MCLYSAVLPSGKDRTPEEEDGEEWEEEEEDDEGCLFLRVCKL